MTLRRLPALAGLAVLAGTCAELAGHRAFTRLVRRDVQALYAGACPARAGVVTEQMLVDLPEPVRRYLRYAGVVGKPFPRTVWLRQEGRMRPGPGQPWMPLAAEEHYAVQPPGFVWAGTLRCGGSRARAGRLALARRVLGAQCCGMERVQWLRGQLADARGGQVVFLSHCLLNQNVRYLGGAGRAGGVSEAVAGYLGRGIGICQLPCPEQRAWGGVLKRRMLLAYGSAGTLRGPTARLLLRPFLWYTRRVYARLARAVTRDILDYRRCGVAVTGVVGIGGSPSCGVATTLDLPAAVGALTRCPAARLDRQTLNQDIVAAHVHPGEGLFIRALRRQLARAGAGVPMDEHDLLAELGLRRRQGQAR